MKIATLDAGDTAYFLRMALGRMRTSWSDFLADCIRNKTDIAGEQLLPVKKVKMAGDRCIRPRYSLTEIKEFVQAVVAVMPRPSEADRAVQKIVIEVDTTDFVMRRAATVLKDKKCK